MTIEELRGKTSQELTQMERTLRDELFKLRMRHYAGQLQQVHELRNKRKDIARLKTVLTEKSAS